MRWALVSAVAVAVVFSGSVQPAVAATNFNQILNDFERQYQLPSGCLARIAKVESSGNPNAKNPKSTATGLFQWLAGSWTRATKVLFGQPLDLSKRNDPVESARVTAFALRGAKNELGGLIAQAKVDECLGLYMTHFLGTGGAKVFFQKYLQNPNQNACSIFPTECSKNSTVLQKTLADVLRQKARELNVSSEISIAGNFEDRNGVPYSRSYANLSPTDFLPRNMQIPPDPERTYPTNYYSGPGTSHNPTTATNQPVSQTLLGQDNTVSTQGPPAALIIAQPRTVPRGSPIIVSWTSVRTSTSKPCQVTLEAGGTKTLLAEANDGTKILPTKKEDAAGTWNFALQCTNSLGSQLPKQTAAVSVQ